MRKVALFVEDKSYLDVDISTPYLGNPGIGGTEYCFANLVWALTAYTKTDVYLFHTGIGNKFPKCFYEEIVNSVYEAVERCSQLDVKTIIIRFNDLTAKDNRLFECLSNFNIKIVAWAHNYLQAEGAKIAAQNKCVQAVVSVSAQQYERYIDHDIIKKSKYIYNIVEGSTYKTSNVRQANAVTYAGAIVHVKGFHILAKNWKKILKEVPDAQLYVIGTGALYNQNEKLGHYGIAEEWYENSFIHSLFA